MTVALQQQVVRMPIFCHSVIDDLPMSLETFRMYAHLARKWGNGKFGALGSYSDMGEHCFRSSYPKASSETLRRKAIGAVRELQELMALLWLVISSQLAGTRAEHASHGTDGAVHQTHAQTPKASKRAKQPLSEDAFLTD